MQISKKEGFCQLCDRLTTLTFHHLIPRKVHRQPHFKKAYSKAELEQGIDICSLCHRGIHQLYDEKTLAQRFDSVEKILADPAMQKHVRWVSKQKKGLIHE